MIWVGWNEFINLGAPMNPTMTKKTYDIVNDVRTHNKSLNRPAVKKKNELSCCQILPGCPIVNGDIVVCVGTGCQQYVMELAYQRSKQSLLMR
jgi:hypothetical protein